MKMFWKLLFFVLSFSLSAYQGYAQGLTIWFDTQEDVDWESQSLPIGNGSIGANIMGTVPTECITFNEKTLWCGGPNTAKGADYYWKVNKPSASVLEEIRRAFTEEDWDTAERLTQQNFNSEVSYDADQEKPFRFGNYTTMGEFRIATGLNASGVSDYRRTLSLDSALVVVQFKSDSVAYRRSYFISYPANVLVMRFSADKQGIQNLVLNYTPNPVSTGCISADGDSGLVYSAALDDNGMEYVVRMWAEAKGGEVMNADGQLTVLGADEVVFYVTADTDYQPNYDPDFADPKTYVGVNPTETTRQWLSAAVRKGYDVLYEEHYNDYARLFRRLSLTLNPTVAREDIPTPQRLKNYRSGQADYYLEELYYQYGRYLLIASSRQGNLPANLQGIWHNQVDGAWHVDYHNNVNLQMNYWHACSANLDECMLPLVDFIRTLVKPGEQTAQAYFGARGWTASVSANIFGFTSPLNSRDMTWNFCPMAGPWLATHLWEYYDYTRDIQFLRTTGYDILKSSAQFTANYLWHKPDGTYTAAPSTSPEHGTVDEGATFAHAVAREILLDAIQASKVLRVDRQERKQWEEVLAHLPPYQVGRYGQLMEWSRDIDDPRDRHRHVNHLFGLYPGHTLSPSATPQWAEAARVVLEHRGDGATGWSMGWKLNLWARLHDGNRAYTLFGNLLKNGTLDNLWDTHPPFQIDGNFGGTAGVTEMLLQSHTGCIHLLPALPDAWADGEVSGLCARGNFEVSMVWKEGRLVEATVVSKSGGRCVVKYNETIRSFSTRKGRSYRLTWDDFVK